MKRKVSEVNNIINDGNMLKKRSNIAKINTISFKTERKNSSYISFSDGNI